MRVLKGSWRRADQKRIVGREGSAPVTLTAWVSPRHDGTGSLRPKALSPMRISGSVLRSHFSALLGGSLPQGGDSIKL